MVDDVEGVLESGCRGSRKREQAPLPTRFEGEMAVLAGTLHLTRAYCTKSCSRIGLAGAAKGATASSTA